MSGTDAATETGEAQVIERLRKAWDDWQGFVKSEDRRVAEGSFLIGATEALHAVGYHAADQELAAMAFRFATFSEAFGVREAP